MEKSTDTGTRFNFRERQILGHKPHFTTTEASLIMGCSESHIVQECKNGTMPHWKHPGAAKERRIARENVLQPARNEVPWIEEIQPKTLILGISSRTYDMANAIVCDDIFALGFAAGGASIDRVHIDANALGIRRSKATELQATIRDALRARMGKASKLAKMPKITVAFRKELYRKRRGEQCPAQEGSTVPVDSTV